MNSPIVNNRLVKYKTFALRLLSLALSLKPTDPCMEDEKESFISYSSTLLKYQIETATEKEEINYLHRCNALGLLSSGLTFIGNNCKLPVLQNEK